VGLHKNKEVAAEEVEKLFSEVIDYFTRVEKSSINLVHRGMKSKEDMLRMVRLYLKDRRVSEELSEEIILRFDSYVFGYHVLEPLLNDDSISDIKIMNYDNVRIKRNGERFTSDVKFKDAADLSRFIDYVAIRNKVPLSDINALATFTDKDSNPNCIMRFTVSTPFINSVQNSYMHVRKISKVKRGWDYLKEVGMLDQETIDYLQEKARTARGILFTGKGASGKTTLMNQLIESIPKNRSGLAIQENEELFSYTHPEIMFQHIVKNSGEGRIQYTLKDLAQYGLLLDLDYFIIGEIKGGEALYFLNASYTGHQCWASVHGVNSTEAIDKLAHYVKYEGDYSMEDIMRMLRYMEVVVFMENFKVKEISEVTGYDEKTGKLIYKRIL